MMTEPDYPAANARYSTGAIVLHWTIAFCMLLQLALGLTMGEGQSAASFARFQLHKSVGITILLLTLARIAWRLFVKPPAMIVGGWERTLAKIIHGIFYVLLLALPLTGWLIVSVSPTHIPTLLYGVVPWPHIPGFEGISAAESKAIGGATGEIHEWLAWLAIVAILLHVAGALKHQLLDRDATFARMAPGAAKGFDWRLGLAGLGVIAAVLIGLFVTPAARVQPNAAVEVEEPADEAEANAADPVPVPAVPGPEPVANATAPAAEATPAEEAAQAAEAEGALADWRVQPGGRLGFTTTWSGSALTGSFTDWDADIAFGDAALDKSHVKVTIRTGSARTGQEQPDSTLPTDEWFATAAFPTATFEAAKFRKTGEGRYVADGTLTIRGKSRPLSLPFTLKIDGDTARMTGNATIDRTAYGVGFASTEEVPADVRIRVSLTAKRRK